MRKFAFFAAVMIAFTSCRQIHGSGNLITEKRQVGDFKGISVGSAFEVELKSGPTTTVEVEADDNLMKYINTRVSGDKLNIEFKKSFSINNAHLKIYITAPEINRINSSGAANVKVLDQLKNTGKIMLEASGAASIEATVDAPEVESDVSGAGNIELKGRTREHTAKASGGAGIKARELLSENAVAETSGAGNIHVYASVSLEAHASGAGNVFYSGGCQVNSHVSGAGSVKKED
ncbi:MAG: DUF2807 domain-containing protein [Chitinophagaceae bacterium]|nr:DUF2807 domain-containing protein [Chitinophagaceae bacterium]